MASDPYFSIIIPAFNRENSVRRAISSCLGQTFPSFEVIVVDDGSEDGTAAAARACNDPRVRVLQHETNRGPCPSRNSGIEVARGNWFVMLDSDFELLTGALERLHRRTQQAGDNVGNVASSCLWDSGMVSPSRLPLGPLDYVGYLRWSDSVEISEYLNCLRREVFLDLRYPDSRAWEWSFHLGLVSRWKLQVSDDMLVKIHTDNENRLTGAVGRIGIQRELDDACDKARNLLEVERIHGEALRRHAQNQHRRLWRSISHYSILCGQRLRGLRYAAAHLGTAPFSAFGWVMLGAAALLPRCGLAWMRVAMRRRVWMALSAKHMSGTPHYSRGDRRV